MIQAIPVCASLPLCAPAPTFLGVVLLIGIVKKNGSMMVDFALASE
jgi:multidrug efflux pump subunit AcrB